MTKVRLINKKQLTGTGCVWESILEGSGWNQLKEEQKFGITTDDWRGYNCSLVRFPHCDDIELTLCRDEIKAA